MSIINIVEFQVLSFCTLAIIGGGYYYQKPSLGILLAIICFTSGFSYLTWHYYPAWKEMFRYDSIRISQHGELYRLFTSSLLHADMDHLGNNMIGLLIYGYFFVVNGKVSPWQLFCSYFGGCIFSDIFSMVTLYSGRLSIGASGGVYAIIGSTLCLGSIKGVRMGIGLTSLYIPCYPLLLGYYFCECYGGIMRNIKGIHEATTLETIG
ncbi:MAG: rhomboid family intramembrane serine protease, partial [Cytophagales bacterium]